MSIPAAFAGIVIIWSTTPLAIKWSSEGAGFVFGVASRMTLGACLCVLLMLVFRKHLPLHKRAIQTYLAAGIGLYAAMLAVYWGAQFIPSGLVSVIFGLTPLVTGVMASQILTKEPFGILQIIGSIAGVIGLAVIFNNSLSHDAIAIQGIVAVLFSVILHSLSSVLVKHTGDDIPALSITTGGLLCSLPFYLITWVVVEHASLPTTLSVKSGLAILYLGIFGSVIGFILFYFVLRRLHAGRVALITLITPVIALLIGQTANNEPVTVQIVMGTMLILLGLGIYQWQELRDSMASIHRSTL